MTTRCVYVMNRSRYVVHLRGGWQCAFKHKPVNFIGKARVMGALVKVTYNGRIVDKAGGV